MKNPLRFSVLMCLLVFGSFFAAVAAHAQTFTVLYSFKGAPDGGQPFGGLLRDGAGNLYGTTGYGGGPAKCGGSGCGVVFKLSSVGTEIVLYDFTSKLSGSGPDAGLTSDPQGNFYGTTNVGGDFSCPDGFGCGTVFELSASGVYTVLHTFRGGNADGARPLSPLVRDSAGNLYGTTWEGGSKGCGGVGCGTVFKLDTSGAETILHVFTGGTDGAAPYAGVILDSRGNLYGTTQLGGNTQGPCAAIGCGVVFEIDAAGAETILYRFTGHADGYEPVCTLLNSGGFLYGTTGGGGDLTCGSAGCGVVFKLDLTGKETVLHTFEGGVADGDNPIAGVVRDSAGNLYGTTYDGGADNVGTVYKLDTAGNLTLLHSFTNGSDGSFPHAGLILDPAGNLYGTAWSGGSFFTCSYGEGCGVVFKITP
jgi:uncharacterized repeat protein (TIGR03803 family)